VGHDIGHADPRRPAPVRWAGRGDLIAGGVTVTDKRRQQVDFTVEVFSHRPSRLVVKYFGAAALEILKKADEEEQ
jgi:ABC-type amino acid transport substrate-binding protein